MIFFGYKNVGYLNTLVGNVVISYKRKATRLTDILMHEN